MKKLITHAELMSALSVLGFPDGDVFQLELRPRETSDVTIGAGKDSAWVLTAVMSGIEKDGLKIVPPYAVRVVTIPVLMPHDERELIRESYLSMGEEELYALTGEQRAVSLAAAIEAKDHV